MSRLAIDRLFFCGHFTGRFVVAYRETDYRPTTFLSLDTQDAEREQLRCNRNFLRLLTALICSHDGVGTEQNFLSASDRNHANILTIRLYYTTIPL